jgi:sodium-coupled monocarboxylate transporter 8/12
MSTISAGINSLTSATVVDFYQRLWKGAKLANEAKQLKLAKYLTLFYGGLVILLAFVVEKMGTLLEASNKVIGLVGGPLLGLFLLGMLFKRANAAGAVIGWFAGLGVLIPICFFSNISFLWYALIGVIVTIGVGLGTSWLFPPPPQRNLEGLILSRATDEGRVDGNPSKTDIK